MYLARPLKLNEKERQQLTLPVPRTSVELSAALMNLFMRTREISTPGVLEKPGFDAWPPAITANGDRFKPITLI